MEKKDMSPKRQEKLYEELVIDVKSVTKVTQGGRQRRFSAVVVVGDRHGKIGLGKGKAAEVPDAIKKAIQSATKNVVKIPLVDNRTIQHEVRCASGACRVLLKPAAAGTGVKAGGAVRDVLSKSLGSRTKLNMATATVNALKSLKTAEHVAELRGKSVEEILG